jgi:hypothetical protein
MNGFEHIAADLLARWSPRHRAGLQEKLDKWNAIAATLSDLERYRAVELRSRMECALANGEVNNTRRLVFALDQMARKKMPPAAGALPAPPNIVFPATLAAMIDEFDAREYAAMMRARNVDV